MNKKGDLEEFMNVALWIVFFFILGTAIYFLIKRLTGI